jgi:superfamily II RNA helicase
MDRGSPAGDGGAAAGEERWRGFTLAPFQRDAIRALEGGRDVLVGAPTGAGKTLIAEYAIEQAVRRGRRAVYTAPIKALSNQKYRDFKAAGVDVGLLTGDVTLQPDAQVLVMTTEILRNSIFESPDELHDVEYAVFDEVHFLDDPERGAVWEESLIYAPRSLRCLCLSATVPNVVELGRWLSEVRGREVVVVESALRPVPLHHRLFHARRGSLELEGLSRERRRARSAELAGRGRGRRRDRRRPPPAAAERSQRAFATERLVDELERKALLPALVFAFSRKDCERLARRNAARELLTGEERERMLDLQGELARLFRLAPAEREGELFAMARRGTAYHHAGLLPIQKELVERMFTSGLVKLLFTTETFALGINMPARTVVFHALEKFDGVSIEHLRCREYQQMSGRAGRQGLDREGLVYSIVTDRDLLEAPIERIVSGRAEPVVSRFGLSYSSLLHLLAAVGRERVHEAWEKSFDEFQRRSASDKAREKSRRRQRRAVEAHLAVLSELGYVDARDRPTERGELARRINGYELQVAELAFGGALDALGPEAMAALFVALTYEQRGRGAAPWRDGAAHAGLRRRVASILARAVACEARHGVETGLRLPDWSLSLAVEAWCAGRSLVEIAEHEDATPGDLCRALRMAIQLMRQVRRALPRESPLRDRLVMSVDAVNRGEVDARAQLELG